MQDAEGADNLLVNTDEGKGLSYRGHYIYV